MTFYVVILDSNLTNVAAFFREQADAVAWRDSVEPTGEIFEAEIDSYRRVTEQTVNL